MKRIRVLYDHQAFTYQKYGGVSLYFSRLYNGLKTSDAIRPYLSIGYTDNQNIKKSATSLRKKRALGTYFIDRVPFARRILNKLLRTIRNSWNRNISIWRIRSGCFDILHATYYDDYFMPHLNDRKKLVITVYDMIHEKFPGGFNSADFVYHNKYRLLNRADAIIAISESTAQDIVDIYRIDRKKIHVIHLANPLYDGYDAEFVPPNLRHYRNNYYLYVGNRGNYKNFNRTLEAVSKLLTKNRDLFFVSAGAESFDDYEIALIRNLNVETQVVHIRIQNAKQMQYLYKNAIVFIYPSLYEGFGLPVLEAFSMGCPVMCSDGSSIPEVAGSAALYFDPWSVKSIYDAVHRISNDGKLREKLVEAGRSQEKKFTWRKVTSMHEKIYSVIINGPPVKNSSTDI